MTLSWHKEIWQRLMQQHQSNILPHALLFSGAQGLGKTLLARELVETLLCQQNNFTGQACGRCRSCLLLQAGFHPELHEIKPDPSGGRIKIDAIRRIIESTQKTVFQGSYKLVLVHSAERMVFAASNAFLKVLEEPTPNTLLILVTSKLGLLPPTIRSRCQLIQFTPPGKEVACQWMQSLASINNQDKESLLTLALGAPLRALDLAENNYLETFRALTQSLVSLLTPESNPSQVAMLWSEWAPENLMEGLMFAFSELIKWNLGLGKGYLLSQSLALFQELNPCKRDSLLLFSYFDKLQVLKSELSLVTVNFLLALENLAYNFQRDMIPLGFLHIH